MLEPLRVAIDQPLITSSAYRAPEVNRRAGGAASSQHPKGEAWDGEALSMSNLDLAWFVQGSGLPFDQLILEFYVPGKPSSGWVHLSHRAGANRGQVLTAVRERGTVAYKNGLPARPA